MKRKSKPVRRNKCTTGAGLRQEAGKRHFASKPENRLKTGIPNPAGVGGFRPGQSGNPGGRPLKTDEERTLEQLCRAKTPDALSTIESIMLEGKTERARLAAAQYIIDRAWGKPTEHVNRTTVEDRRVQAADSVLAEILAESKDGNGRSTVQ